MGWSGNGLRVLGITLMPPSGNPRPSRCAALAAKIEKLSQTVRPSLGWDQGLEMRTKLAAPLLGMDAADHLEGVQYEITDGFGRGVPGARARFSRDSSSWTF